MMGLKILNNSRHRLTVININEMNVFDQSEQACHSYYNDTSVIQVYDDN